MFEVRNTDSSEIQARELHTNEALNDADEYYTKSHNGLAFNSHGNTDEAKRRQSSYEKVKENLLHNKNGLF